MLLVTLSVEVLEDASDSSSDSLSSEYGSSWCALAGFLGGNDLRLIL